MPKTCGNCGECVKPSKGQLEEVGLKRLDLGWCLVGGEYVNVNNTVEVGDFYECSDWIF